LNHFSINALKTLFFLQLNSTDWAYLKTCQASFTGISGRILRTQGADDSIESPPRKRQQGMAGALAARGNTSTAQYTP